MCIPSVLEKEVPSPMKKVATTGFANTQQVVCDAKQYEADLASVIGGYVSKPVTKEARLGMS